MRRDRLKQKFLDNLADSRGIVLTACQLTGVSRKTYYNWFNTDADFASDASDVIEDQIDKVESKLLDGIDGGDMKAIIFYLRTKGKHRGYIEPRYEMPAASGGNGGTVYHIEAPANPLLEGGFVDYDEIERDAEHGNG